MKETVKNNNKKEKRGSNTNTKIPSFLKKFVRVTNYLDKNIKSKPLRIMICVHAVFITSYIYGVDIYTMLDVIERLKVMFFSL